MQLPQIFGNLVKPYSNPTIFFPEDLLKQMAKIPNGRISFCVSQRERRMSGENGAISNLCLAPKPDSLCSS